MDHRERVPDDDRGAAMRGRHLGLPQGGPAVLLHGVGGLQHPGHRTGGPAPGARGGGGGSGGVELPRDVRGAGDVPGHDDRPAAGGLGAVAELEHGRLRGVASRGSWPGELEEVSPDASQAQARREALQVEEEQEGKEPRDGEAPESTYRQAIAPWKGYPYHHPAPRAMLGAIYLPPMSGFFNASTQLDHPQP